MLTFDSIMAMAVVAVIFAIGDFVSEKTRAIISMLFVAVVLFMIGFWTGLIPTDVFATAGISGIATVMVYMILINNGTLLNLREFLSQWKTVVLGLVIVIGGGFLMFVIARIFIGQNLAVAIVGPITGGFVSGLVVSEEANLMGLTDVSLLATIIIAVQGVVGYPLGSFLLRKEATRLLKGYRGGTIVWAPKIEEVSDKAAGGRKRWQLPSMPEKYQTSYILLAKLLIFAFIASRLSTLTGINGFILCLIVGVVAKEFNLIEYNIMGKAGAYGFGILAVFSYVVSGLANVTPSMMASMVWPIIVAFVAGVIGLFAVGLLAGKILGFSVPMSLAVATTRMYGFPGTLILSEEISSKVGQTEDERKMLLDKILPVMLVSGFTTLTIVSVIIAGFFNRFLIA